MTMGHVALLGLMGSGKTSVGAALASSLGWAHRDSDADIAAETGRSARAIAATDGIDHLHELEARHLLRALADPEDSVISVAASTIDDPVTRAALRDPGVRTIWLRASPATLAGRVHAGDHRPEFGPGLVGVLEAQAARRGPWFASVSDEIVDVDGLSIDQVASALVR